MLCYHRIDTMIADIADYRTRIQAGKVREASIIIALRGAGMTIEVPTPGQDQQQKIDCWLVDRFGEKHTLQIKSRENGDDIIFEIIKDIHKDVPGRDMYSSTEYYFLVDSVNKGHLYLMPPIRRFAQQVLDIVMNDLSVNNTQTFWRGRNGWQARITTDRAHGNQKLMGYFSPKLFTSLAEIYCPK